MRSLLEYCRDIRGVIFVDDKGGAARAGDLPQVQLLQLGRLVLASLALDAEEQALVAGHDVGHARGAEAAADGVEVIGAQRFKLGDHLVFDFFLRRLCHATSPLLSPQPTMCPRQHAARHRKQRYPSDLAASY